MNPENEGVSRESKVLIFSCIFFWIPTIFSIISLHTGPRKELDALGPALLLVLSMFLTTTIFLNRIRYFQNGTLRSGLAKAILAVLISWSVLLLLDPFLTPIT